MDFIVRPTLVLLLLGILISLVACQSTSDTTTTTPTPTPSTTTKKPTTPPSKPTTTLSPDQECAKHNGSCDDCVKNAKCMYCNSDDSCKLYPTGKVLPVNDPCALSDLRWGVCWLNFEAMIIAVSTIGGVIILTITCCCVYCCCCRGRSKKKYEKDDARFESQKMERKMKQDERRNERKGRLDEIRRKYGLVKDDAPYQRFDA